MIIRILLNLILLFYAQASLASQIALAFENLPSPGQMSITQMSDMNDKILKALTTKKITSVGFVSEENLYQDTNVERRIAVLKKWLENGQELGNLTYAHKSLHLVSEKEYFGEIIKGEHVTRRLMQEYNQELRYFIPPYFHIGVLEKTRKSLKKFLHDNHYILVPVTISNDDWVFNVMYLKAVEDGDDSARNIIKKYLTYTRAKFEFYGMASRQIFGRDIDQIWVLHLNAINADCIDDLLKIPVQFGYEFGTVGEVLGDHAYSSRDNYYGKNGSSWLYRWDMSGSKVVDWSREPDIANIQF